MQIYRVVLYAGHYMYLSINAASTIADTTSVLTNSTNGGLHNTTLIEGASPESSSRTQEKLQRRDYRMTTTETKYKPHLLLKRIKRQDYVDTDAELINEGKCCCPKKNFVQPAFITERKFKEMVDYFKKVAKNRTKSG